VQPWSYCAVIPYAESCVGDHNKLIQASASHSLVITASAFCSPLIWFIIFFTVLDKAVAIAKSPVARGLPGWGQGSVDPANC
jgi:hypothetical protein